MPLAAFKDIMADAELGRYAVGYFESWDLESLLAVADAAEATRSPVILGFSGIYLSHPQVAAAPLGIYAAMGLEACRGLTVPACLLFNESPAMDRVLEAVELGFQLVMFTDENLSFDQQVAAVRKVVDTAHSNSIAVEGELAPLPGAGSEAPESSAAPALDSPERACDFLRRTGVDSLAVNIGQAHLHGRRRASLDMERLAELKAATAVPLVLHAASSIADEDLVEAIRLGVRKINVGSKLKRAYFDALRRACADVGDNYNPYDVVGSGLGGDVLMAGRNAVRKTVEKMMALFGSASRAD